MKTPLFIFLFSSLISFGQSSVEFAFNEVYIGRNVSLNWKKHYPSFNFSAGITYHINRLDKIPKREYFKNTALTDSNNFAQHFGVQFGFEYYFYKNNHFKIGAFYNNQISYINHLLKINETYDYIVPYPQSEFDVAFTKKEIVYGPVLSIDNVVGITIENKLFNNLYLNLKGGFGLLNYKIYGNSLMSGNGKAKRGRAFTSYFSIGIGYKFLK